MKKNLVKRIAVMAMVGAMALTGTIVTTTATTTTAYAQEYRSAVKAGTYKVTGTKNFLAVRSSAAYDASNIKAKLYNGDSFTVESTTNNGYAYGHTSKGVYGYVNASYLKKANNNSSYNNPTVKTGTKKVFGTTNFLAVRTYAGYDASNIITKLYDGDLFTVEYTTDNGYAYGYTESGVAGYVNASFLK